MTHYQTVELELNADDYGLQNTTGYYETIIVRARVEYSEHSEKYAVNIEELYIRETDVELKLSDFSVSDIEQINEQLVAEAQSNARDFEAYEPEHEYE